MALSAKVYSTSIFKWCMYACFCAGMYLYGGGGGGVCVWIRVCVCACVRACVWACVRTCIHVVSHWQVLYNECNLRTHP